MTALGISLFLIAVGAILTWGVSASVEGASIPTIGTILMVVGGLGIVMTFLFLMSFSPFGSHDSATDEHIHHA